MHRFLAVGLVPFLALACSKKKGAESPEDTVVYCASPLSAEDVTLPPDEVHPIVEAHQQLLGYCYNRERERNPTLQGSIDVHIVVETNGKASQVCAGEVSIQSEAVTSCVLRLFKDFDYGAQDEQMATIYPVDFSPY